MNTRTPADPGPDVEGVEMNAIYKKDGSITCHLGHQGSGIPSIAESLMEMVDPDQSDWHSDYCRALVEALYTFLKAGPVTPLDDAARFYEITDSGWYLTALTGIPEGGRPLQRNFPIGMIEQAAILWLSEEAGQKPVEFMNGIVRAALAARLFAGVEAVAKGFWTSDQSAEDLKEANSGTPPKWARLVKQLMSEGDRSVEAGKIPGQLARLLMWKAVQDFQRNPVRKLPVRMTEEMANEIRQSMADAELEQMAGWA